MIYQVPAHMWRDRPPAELLLQPALLLTAAIGRSGGRGHPAVGTASQITWAELSTKTKQKSTAFVRVVVVK